MHIYLHLEDAVALAHAGLLGGAVGQHCADVLQGRVELAVDAAQLAALAHLPADVEPEAGLGLVDGDAARALRRRGLGRLEVLLLLLSGTGWPEATEPPVVPGVPDHRRHRRVHYNHSAHVRVALAQLARQLARARTHIHTRGTTISRRLAAAWLALSPHLAVPVFLSLSLSLSLGAGRPFGTQHCSAAGCCCCCCCRLRASSRLRASRCWCDSLARALLFPYPYHPPSPPTQPPSDISRGCSVSVYAYTYRLRLPKYRQRSLHFPTTLTTCSLAAIVSRKLALQASFVLEHVPSAPGLRSL